MEWITVPPAWYICSYGDDYHDYDCDDEDTHWRHHAFQLSLGSRIRRPLVSVVLASDFIMGVLCSIYCQLCESSPRAPTYGYPIASSSYSDRGFFTASEADDIARVFFLSGTRSTSGTGSTTPGEKTNLENSPSGDRTHALRHTLYQQARTIPTEPRRPICTRRFCARAYTVIAVQQSRADNASSEDRVTLCRLTYHCISICREFRKNGIVTTLKPLSCTNFLKKVYVFDFWRLKIQTLDDGFAKASDVSAKSSGGQSRLLLNRVLSFLIHLSIILLGDIDILGQNNTFLQNRAHISNFHKRLYGDLAITANFDITYPSHTGADSTTSTSRLCRVVIYIGRAETYAFQFRFTTATMFCAEVLKLFPFVEDLVLASSIRERTYELYKLRVNSRLEHFSVAWERPLKPNNNIHNYNRVNCHTLLEQVYIEQHSYGA
ncbi:unnamed protein product [Trichogramma brassicae]|uniref:Uncharacterized protein n=1 Tax=Trichogramma brassicae TaxID=86971 RepID=A0A6H5IL48_9HYME|nr:unnamed protein product [Trichogramma brassicae]